MAGLPKQRLRNKKQSPLSPAKVRTKTKTPTDAELRALEATNKAVTSEIRRKKAVLRYKRLQAYSGKLNPLNPKSKDLPSADPTIQSQKIIEEVPGKESSNQAKVNSLPSSNTLTDLELKTIEECARAVELFGVVYLEHHLSSGYCQLHKDVYRLLYGLLSGQVTDLKEQSVYPVGGGMGVAHASRILELHESPTSGGFESVDSNGFGSTTILEPSALSRGEGVEGGTGLPANSLSVALPGVDSDGKGQGLVSGLCEKETPPDRIQGQETPKSAVVVDSDQVEKANEIKGEMPIVHGRDKDIFGNREIGLDVEYMRRWRKAVIAAPRGHAKTTSLMVFILWCVCYGMRKYILLVSDSEDQSRMHLDSIKAELEANEKIRRCFGDLVGGVWGAEAIETSNGVRIQCRGAGQKIRGLKYRNKRPDLVIVDDLLSDDLVETEERRVKIKKWFMSALLRCMSKDGAIIVTGTILHEADLMSDLLKSDAGWVKRRYEACVVEDGELKEPILWPDLYTLEDLKAMREEYAHEGEISLFYREMFNRIVSNESSPFKRDWFKYSTYKELEDTTLTNFVMVDPAYTIKKSADQTCFCVIGVSAERKWYVKACILGRWNITGVIDQWFEVIKTYRPLIVGIQSVDWDRVFKPLIQDEMRRRNLIHTVQSLTTYSPITKGLSNKRNRINQLSKYYKNGTIIHMKGGLNVETLEQQLLSHPFSKYDDCCFVAGTKIATPLGDRPIEKIKPGDYVLSPGGLSRVEHVGNRPADVVDVGILHGTREHKVMSKTGWVNLSSLTERQGLDTLSLCRSILWTLRKSLNGMGIHTTSWGRDAITYEALRGVNREDGKALRDSMSRCGRAITELPFRKALSSTIETATRLTTTLLIWSAYRVANIIKNTPRNMTSWLLSKKLERPQENGTDQRPEERGTAKTANNAGSDERAFTFNANAAGKTFSPTSPQEPCPVQANATNEFFPTETTVFNLKTTSGVFYANQILVSNSDALSLGVTVLFPPQAERKSKIPAFMLDLQSAVDPVSGY